MDNTFAGIIYNTFRKFESDSDATDAKDLIDDLDSRWSRFATTIVGRGICLDQRYLHKFQPTEFSIPSAFSNQSE